MTLIETLVAGVTLAVLAALAVPVGSKNRFEAADIGSRQNLGAIAVANAIYEGDNGGRLATYSWARGQFNVIGHSSNPVTMTTSNPSANMGWQNTDLLRRMTGRVDGLNKIGNTGAILWSRNFSHLVLRDYSGFLMGDEVFASPLDAQLRSWQADPIAAEEGRVLPYSVSVPWAPCLFSGGPFSLTQVLKRWPYSSSYLPTAFIAVRDVYDDEVSPDGVRALPTYDQRYLWPIANFNPDEYQRSAHQVRYPAQKVFYFEEYDRDRPDVRMWAWDDSTPNVQFFDGSVAEVSSAEANDGANPDFPTVQFRIAHAGFDKFPLETDRCGLAFSPRFQWTRHGLKGLDFGTRGGISPAGARPEFGRPERK